MTANNNEEISISGTLTYAVFKKYNWYHKRKIVIGYFVFAFLCFIYVFSNFVSGVWFLVYPIVIFLSLITSGIISLILLFLVFWKARQEYKSDKIIKNEVSFVIDNKGINQKVRSSNANIEWSDILVAKENKDMFRLYISKNKAIVLPKRFFISKEDIHTVKTLIERNLNSKK